VEPWWKLLHSLALARRRIESWGEICAAVGQATTRWNVQRHPFI